MLVDIFLKWNPDIIFRANFLAKTTNGQNTSQYFDLF